MPFPTSATRGRERGGAPAPGHVKSISRGRCLPAAPTPLDCHPPLIVQLLVVACGADTSAHARTRAYSQASRGADSESFYTRTQAATQRAHTQTHTITCLMPFPKSPHTVASCTPDCVDLRVILFEQLIADDGPDLAAVHLLQGSSSFLGERVRTRRHTPPW